ncbi:hypothetical protein [Candidatus Leptofilum sp.]|uniref:hypothetical protein n=1 Tax=Candidatus Leptofilum sp. TaxID=3241576 RepID=UPI003B59B820
MKQIPFLGWENCIQLSNRQVELVVTADVGPRIIYLGFVNDENLFATIPGQLGRTGDAAWQNYGGHRFWLAPEQMPHTYYPDNNPVTVEDHGRFVRFIAPIEITTRMQKTVDVALDPHEAKVTVTHTVQNLNPWAIELAPWALSVMAPGGMAVLPLPPRGNHRDNLLPTGHLVTWAYTNMADPRWTWGEQFVLLRQDPGMTTPQKLGWNSVDGWLGYVRDGRFFLKQFAPHAPQATYPDRNSSAEIYTDANILELESLAPLTQLAPNATASHTETWQLFADVLTPISDADVVANILPLVGKRKS